MKKYVKPELFYERFELTQHIADCAWEINSKVETECHAVADPDFLPGFDNLFAPNVPDCHISSDVYTDYCYQDGAQGVNVFAS